MRHHIGDVATRIGREVAIIALARRARAADGEGRAGQIGAQIIDAAFAGPVGREIAVEIDRAAHGAVCPAQIGEQQAIGDVWIVRTVGRVTGERPGGAGLAVVQAVALAEAIRFVELIGDGDVAPAIGEVVAIGAGNEARTCVATLRNADLPAQAQALEVALEDEVDHARDAIGAINGGGAAGQHVDALDQIGRDGVDVYRGGAG